MAEYLEPARAVIEEREGVVSADTTTFGHLNDKQCTSHLWRKLRATHDYFSWTLSYLQPATAWPTFLQISMELAQTILRQRESATRSADTTILLLNEIQCTHLWRVIRVVYNYLSSSQLPTPRHERHEYLQANIFREFYVLVRRANAIVQELSSEQSWLHAAILQGNHRLAFKELILDLQACVRLFHDITQHLVPIEASATMWRQDADMEGDAQVDASNLRSRVEDLLARPALGEEDRHLAQYLLQREESMSSSYNQDVDLPQYYNIAKDGYPTLGRPIGKGTSGAVLEVKWLGMPCAKKYFGVTDNEGSMKECLKEMVILAKINHPNIVKLLCTSVQLEVSFVMELMPMSLSDFIKERGSSPDGIVSAAAIDMMLQIARGIEYLHDHGIVHRDLKSSNILVSPSGDEKLREEGYTDMKLTDFGLAKMKVPEFTNPTQEMMGTSCWRAPEAFEKDQPIDWKKADAYSFAMTCSEILTGEKPFKSAPLSELYIRITSGERPKLPASCPEDLASLLEACWKTEPHVRPSFTEIRMKLTSIKRHNLLNGTLKPDQRAPLKKNPSERRSRRSTDVNRFSSPAPLQTAMNTSPPLDMDNSECVSDWNISTILVWTSQFTLCTITALSLGMFLGGLLICFMDLEIGFVMFLCTALHNFLDGIFNMFIATHSE